MDDRFPGEDEYSGGSAFSAQGAVMTPAASNKKAAPADDRFPGDDEGFPGDPTPSSKPAASKPQYADEEMGGFPGESTSKAHGGGAKAAAKPAKGGKDVDSREAELARREAALADKEKMLNSKANRIDAKGREKNWPFPCMKLTYHNINEEIPAGHRPLIRKVYALWMFNCLCLLWNWLVIVMVVSTNGATGASGTIAVWASIYLVLGIPGSWKFWYRALYYGARDNRGFSWMLFFFNFFCHSGFAVVMGLGVVEAAGSGIFLMLSLYVKKFKMLGTCSLVAVVMWCLNVVICLYVFKAAHYAWKHTGVEAQVKKDVAKAGAKAAIEVAASDAGFPGQDQYNSGGGQKKGGFDGW